MKKQGLDSTANTAMLSTPRLAGTFHFNQVARF
jgi:hypothetical protein